MSDKKLPNKFDVIKGLNASFKEEAGSAHDLIMEQATKAGVIPGRQKPPVGDKLKLDMPTVPPLVIDGYKLPRTNIQHLDALTVLMYIIAKEFSKNPRIRSILDQVQFKFPDLEGHLIYPLPVLDKKQTKKRTNARSKK